MGEGESSAVVVVTGRWSAVHGPDACAKARGPRSRGQLQSMMKKSTKFLSPLLCVCALAAGAGEALRPPAVPLVACDPYFSIWSPAEKLTDADTVHWTGKPHRLTSLVRIDGKAL